MAKKRRVAASEATAPDERLNDQPWTPPGLSSNLPMMIAAATIGGACVYVSYHPSDSVGVENGDALWFGVIALLLATITWGSCLWHGGFSSQRDRPDRLSLIIDFVPWLLAGWMMLAAFATAPPGNLRAATNEAWLWISGAAVFSAARRLLRMPGTQTAVVALLVVCASGLAVHGLHQEFLSLPQSRSGYLADPDRMLREAGIEAPEGSAERMRFESRLFDGGPTGTFALANSLAGVLLLGVTVSIGVLRFAWPSVGWIPRSGVCLCLGLCVFCLVAVRSRSALLAAVTAVVVFFVWDAISRSDHGQRSKLGIVIRGLIAIGVVVLATAIGLVLFARAEWIEQAPASVAFRLQYWRSTLAMTIDRPLFSAGPGNFQSMYLRYREDSASEQIAEPHNFLFETMASGGFLALAALVVLLIAICWYIASRNSNQTTFADETTDDKSSNWVWLGAGMAVVLVWLIGAAAGRTPDFQAHLFVVPIAIALAWSIWPAFASLSEKQLVLIASVTLIALLVHLTAAGGWTVPGLAIHIWLLAALLTRIVGDDAARTSRPGRALIAIALGLMMLAILRSMSLIPVQTAQVATVAFEYSHRHGHLRRAEAALDRAVEADPWSPNAVVWRADLLHWKLIREGDSDELRRQWQRDLAMATERAGESPSLWETIGRQQIHVYQRFGREPDLAAAEETFSKVVAWNPADQHAVAQLAAIRAARGESAEAKKLADRARYLSELGNNIERALERQLIYVPQPHRQAAARQPVLAPASELLSNQLL